MKRTFVFIACVACLVGSAAAQRFDTPPLWSVGTWTGHNDYIRADVELRVAGNGVSSLDIRSGRNSKTLRGRFQSGLLDFNGDHYIIRETRGNLQLTREGNRDDNVLLKRVGGQDRPGAREDLSIIGPRANDRLPLGPVLFEGTSTFPEVRIEILRGSDRVQVSNIRTRDGRWEFRPTLPAGHYNAVIRAGDRVGSIERRVIFDVGGMGRTYIESPEAGATLSAGNVTITGTSEAPDVEVEVYRGREQITRQLLSVRDGRFSTRVNLGWGSFQLTVRGKENGVTLGTDRRGFKVVDRNGEPARQDLRLDRPSDGGRFDAPVNFEGSAPGTDVRVQIRRGRDEVFNQLVSVRAGRFRVRADLGRGHYEATIIAQDNGRVLSSRRISFDVN